MRDLIAVVLCVGAALVGTPASGQTSAEIVFTREDFSDDSRVVMVVEPDGSNPTRVTTPGQFVYVESPAWSADRSRIALSALPAEGDDTAFNIFVIGRVGTDLRQLTHSPLGSQSPGWSPSSQRLIFSRIVDGVRQIWVMDDDGSNERPITDCGSPCGGGSWSPVGPQIVYSRQLGQCDAIGTSDIALMTPRGTGHRRVTKTPRLNEYGPTWSPDGKWILYWRTPRCGDGRAGYFLIRPDGSDRRRVPLDDDAGGVALSPDGNRVVYMTNHALFTANLDGSNVTRLFPDQGSWWDGGPDW